jgi:hypothetical protein
MLREPACATVVVTMAVLGVTLWASAGAILSAICAIRVPRPAMMAAKIIMLRITPHSIRTPDITTLAAKSRLTAVGKVAILTKRMSEVLMGGLDANAFTCVFITMAMRFQAMGRDMCYP